MIRGPVYPAGFEDPGRRPFYGPDPNVAEHQEYMT